jgi:hypothetical protein
LIGFVKDDDVRSSVVGFEPVDEFVSRCRLAVDIEGLVEAFERTVEDLEAGVVSVPHKASPVNLT